jgi:hypothetical protein
VAFDWAALIAGGMGAAATLAGLVFAGRQLRQTADEHRAAEKWRRTEFAARLVERLNTDEELSF